MVVALLGIAFVARRDTKRVTPTVAVVGDSITVLIRDELAHEFAHHYSADMRAVNAMRIDQMLSQLEKALRRKPRDVVVDLGSNDALQAELHPDWQAAFEKMVALLVPVQCVVIVNINTVLNGQPTTERFARDINGAITMTARQHANIHVLNWDALVRAPGGGALMQPDGIHPNAKGQAVLAAQIRKALDRDCHS